MESDTRPAVPLTLAVVAGVALWLGASLLSGRREPWDAPLYWSAAYPVALVACAALGGACPDRPWRWALALFEGQFVGMLIRNGELGGLWPLGMLLFAVLAVPAVGAAYAGRAVRLRLNAR